MIRGDGWDIPPVYEVEAAGRIFEFASLDEAERLAAHLIVPSTVYRVEDDSCTVVGQFDGAAANGGAS